MHSPTRCKYQSFFNGFCTSRLQACIYATDCLSVCNVENKHVTLTNPVIHSFSLLGQKIDCVQRRVSVTRRRMKLVSSKSSNNSALRRASGVCFLPAPRDLIYFKGVLQNSNSVKTVVTGGYWSRKISTAPAEMEAETETTTTSHFATDWTHKYTHALLSHLAVWSRALLLGLVICWIHCIYFVARKTQNQKALGWKHWPKRLVTQ